MRHHSRRKFLATAGAAASLPFVPSRIFAATPANTPVHGLSAFGELKYPADFTRFDYVNADAPKGGQMNFQPPNWIYNQTPFTFNTLNSLALKGESPPRTELCFDALMTRALDEPDALYGLLAESVTISDDRNVFEFRMRPQARWHDGTPLTAEDASFSYDLYKEKGHPDLLLPLRDLTEAIALDKFTLRLTFNGKQSAQNILAIAVMPIVSKAFYTANEFEAATLTPPLGSGPYRIGKVTAGRSIVLERVDDYWGRDLPVQKGQNNFDRIRMDFYQERQAAFEAFKKGDTTFRQEFTSRVWATEYNFPAIADGRVVKREFPGEAWPQMQAVALNQRRPQFRDVRVRRAIALCFDFEWSKRALFYGSYERSQSTFENSDFKAQGSPSAGELALLEPLRADVPPETFGDAPLQPVSDGSGRDRKLLGQAAKLLAEAARQIERVGLGDQIDQLAGSLSLGQQRIVEIARALCVDPLLLLLDEPAAGLRHMEKQRLAALLRQLRDGGMSVLLVEHDMGFVMDLADRVVVLDFGTKIAEGTPAQIKTNPDVIRAYLGATA